MKLPRLDCITNITITQHKLDFEECISGFNNLLRLISSMMLIIMTEFNIYHLFNMLHIQVVKWNKAKVLKQHQDGA